MNEAMIYKKIWRLVILNYLLRKQDKYIIKKSFVICDGKSYVNTNHNILIEIDKLKIYNRLKKDGFNITEYVDNENGEINAYFTILRKDIEKHAKDETKNKRILK